MCYVLYIYIYIYEKDIYTTKRVKSMDVSR